MLRSQAETLALRLHYLVTVFGAHDEAQTKIARIVQVFHTTPIIGRSMLQPPLSTAVDSVTVRRFRSNTA